MTAEERRILTAALAVVEARRNPQGWEHLEAALRDLEAAVRAYHQGH